MITPTQQDRDALVTEAMNATGMVPTYINAYSEQGDSDGCRLVVEHVADAILTSDWLAEHVRAKQAEAYELACSDHWSSRNPYLPTEGAEHV